MIGNIASRFPRLSAKARWIIGRVEKSSYYYVLISFQSFFHCPSLARTVAEYKRSLSSARFFLPEMSPRQLRQLDQQNAIIIFT
jgi:hypothetical protein